MCSWRSPFPTDYLISDDQVSECLTHIGGLRQGAKICDKLAPHSFPARMPLSVAEFIVGSLSKTGDIVLDPMVGFGTTLIAAKRLGRYAIGFDLDPLAVTIARCFTQQADFERLKLGQLRIEETAKRLLENGLRSSTIKAIYRNDYDFLDFWFPKRSKKELYALAEAIRKDNDQEHKDIFWTVFSSLIIRKSAGPSYAIDLAHSRPHKKTGKKIVWPLETWPELFSKTIRYLRGLITEQNGIPPRVELCDARSLGLDDESIDLVLTSPPYLSAIDYIRAHKFSLIWFGYQMQELREIRARMIGAERRLQDDSILGNALERQLVKYTRSDRRRAHIRRYLVDIQDTLREVRRVLKPGGILVYVVGPSIITRRRHDAEDVLQTLAMTVGLNKISCVKRGLLKNRRALPPPRATKGQNSLNKRMKSEYYIAFRKPSSKT